MVTGVSSADAGGPSGLLHRTICDAREMGFRLLRDNLAFCHRIYVQNAWNNVTQLIDAAGVPPGVGGME
jgi:hypothetical protein